MATFISSIADAGVALQQARFETEVQVAVAKKQIDALKFQGEAALQLIEAAAISDPAVGGNLDILA